MNVYNTDSRPKAKASQQAMNDESYAEYNSEDPIIHNVTGLDSSVTTQANHDSKLVTLLATEDQQSSGHIENNLKRKRGRCPFISIHKTISRGFQLYFI